MKRLWEAYRLTRPNWRRLLALELFYKLLVALFFIPLLSGCFSLVMRISGYAYLTRENVRFFATHPATLALALLLLALAVSFALMDISAVVYTMDQSRQRNRVRVADILRFSVRNATRAWRRGNLLLVPLLLLILPFLNVGMAFGMLNTISIPELVTRFVRSNRFLLAGLGVVVLLLYLLAMRWLYAFHCFTLEGCGSREACRRSAALSRGHRLRDYGALLLTQALFGLATLAVVVLLALLATLLGRLLTRVYVLQWLTSTAVWFAALAALVIAFAFSTPVAYGCVGWLFYRRKAAAGEAVIPAPAPRATVDSAREKTLRTIYVVAAALIAAGSVYLGYLINSGAINPQIEYLRTTEITAHRGASALYPENTMAAFRGAWELGADWVELDVQQTRDGKIIVLHDTSLKRTTGLNKRTWELDYEQIAQLDAGSRFSREFAGERVPLLSEVAEFARDTGLRLNIELKPSGREKDFEQGVIDIIREYGIEERCVITSQVYQVLRNVKALDGDIATVYVTSLAYGDINRLDAADHFSVEATSATNRLVSRVHNAGKQVYAWTVNTKNGIKRMISRNVDNIVTDNVELARQCVTESHYGELLSDLVKTIE